ncbi:TIGR03757 family integrating conjugative element protein [Enterobacter hormaechei]|uniref:TIGR03757 family integrating conjugative element protein n=1 Tax=Enterobacter hormaechei TaxID=158836 RepID=UPI000F68C149|nr:TIGR03757 family integrating conjugative element protein [Enterobacter hormaechei]QXR31237.1 TIGR03757 family integrating conjugative element protein [Enterobacter hormaechei]
MKSLIPLFFLCSISPGFAAVTVFTTVGHPAINADADTRMVFLDAPDQQQNAMFGQLSNNPEAAAQAAKSGLQQISAEQQQQLVEAWRGVIAAWKLGIEKYPAVVFDDVDVVYGTTDVDLAKNIRAQGGHQ